MAGFLYRFYIVNTRFARNVAVVMLSLFYTRGDQLLVRHVEIPHLFLSGFSVEDAPIDRRRLSKPLICIQDLYAKDRAYQLYRSDLI